MMDSLIVLKKSVAACGPLKGPKQAFSRLSINPSCFDFKAKPPRALDQSGDVIRWSIFDLSRRAASYSFFLPIFLAQTRGVPDYWWESFSDFLQYYSDVITVQLSAGYPFVDVIFHNIKQVMGEILFSEGTGNPIFLVLRFSFRLFLLFVVYRVIRRAITKV